MNEGPPGSPFRYCCAVALTATIFSFTVALSDSDRQLYETLEFRVAQHPSETAEYLVARVLAYCLEYTEGLTFSKGLSEPDVPALTVHDLTGALTAWIEVGLPEPARLHKATKAARRVAVYAHKDPGTLLGRLAAEPVHRASDIEFYAFDRELIDAVSKRLARRMTFDMVVTDRHLYLSLGSETISGAVQRLSVE
jgi:uncharacterized protein YaeQ